MSHARIFAAALMLILSGSFVGTDVNAAPIVVNGATFDAPSSCQSAQTALVCKVDAQQLELWVTRKTMGAAIKPTDSFMRKMEYFTEQHQGAVVNILRSTSNDGFTQFSDYGGYSALGASMAGKGVVSSPTVRFASVLHDDEIWEFLEVVATRTPAIDALSTALRRSLVLPAARVVQAPVMAVAPEVPKKVDGSPLVATFNGKLLALELPGYLDADVLEDTTERLQVSFRHKTRPTAGPNLVISLRAPNDPTATTASIESERSEAKKKAVLGSATLEMQNAMQAAAEKGASSWVTAYLSYDHNTILHKSDFIDVIYIRYGWPLPGAPTRCPCERSSFSLQHALDCPLGGYRTIQHNERRDG